MKGAIFVSDERMRYAAEVLVQKEIDVDIACDSAQGERIVASDPKGYDFILAPVRGATDGKMTLNGESFYVDHFLRNLKAGTPVITGFKSEYLLGLGLHVISFQDDDEFCWENSRLTAEGVLKMLIEDTSESIYSYRYDILGTGKSGSCIKDLLEKMNLSVRIISHSGKKGSISLDEWKSMEPAPVVINTTPKAVSDVTKMELWRKEVTIIDISSIQMDKQEIEKIYPNIHYFPAPPLPGIVAPKTAGVLLGNFVWKVVNKL